MIRHALIMSSYPPILITRSASKLGLESSGPHGKKHSNRVKSSLKTTGIFPYNPKIIPDSAYSPSDAFDVNLENQEVEPVISSPLSAAATPSSPISTVSIPVSCPVGTVFELSPRQTVIQDPFMPSLSLNNTFDEIAANEPVTTTPENSQLD